MDELCELRLQHNNEYVIPFKSPLYSSTCLCEVVLSQNYYRNSIDQSSFISFLTHMVRPLLKLKHFVLLVMCTAMLTSFFTVR